ncbi:MAG: hypothetical protein JWO36_3347 [Myxococcales bacterium]|nr:hypothetical protein [Myxococcales bacterium]
MKAGWWTLLVAIVLLFIQWASYLVVVSRQPAWFIGLLGPDMTWARTESMFLQAMILFRLFVGAFTILLVWATFWSASLAKRRRASRTPATAPHIEQAIPAT